MSALTAEPTVSVLIATWNAGRHLPATLASVLEQTHPRLDVIVVDDGSSDDTAARVAPFGSRIRYLRRRHEGLAAARNAGLAVAEGDYLALLDADDLWTSDKLAVQLEVARRHPDAGLIACDGVEFEEDRVLAPRLLVGPLAAKLAASPRGEVSGRLHAQLIHSSTISCPAQVLIPRRVALAIGPFADLDAQDYDYYLRIAQRFPIVLHRDSLARWRYRPEGISGPRPGRERAWKRMKLAVLETHRRRCTGEERRCVDRRMRKLVRELAREAYRRGIAGNRADGRGELARLLRVRPWRPTALRYWMGLELPDPLRRAALRVLR
jgi:glycosyltransferase involved in cell wall biosynthesis